MDQEKSKISTCRGTAREYFLKENTLKKSLDDLNLKKQAFYEKNRDCYFKEEENTSVLKKNTLMQKVVLPFKKNIKNLAIFMSDSGDEQSDEGSYLRKKCLKMKKIKKSIAEDEDFEF